MADTSNNHDAGNAPSDDEVLLDSSEAAEIVPDDPDHPMDSDNEGSQPDNDTQEEEIQLQNDSIAYFDHHADSIFCIANHPLHPATIATGGGDDTTYIFSADVPSPVLPRSYETNPSSARSSLSPIAKLTGHTDSVNALTYTLPHGDFVLTGGLDGFLRVHSTTTTSPTPYPLVASAQEVPEINFLSPCPHPTYPNAFALGASDGSIWIYTIDLILDPQNPLQVLQAYYLHTSSATAGAWTPDGKLLATVSEDGSFYVWDPFGEAAGAGITSSGSGQATVVGLTTADQRFAVEDGLFSVAVSPSGAFAAVGGAHGVIRIVGLPRFSASSSTTSTTTKNTKSSSTSTKSLKSGAGSSKKSAASDGGATGQQGGQILASLQVQSESIETLAFSPHHPLLAAGSVDGSICLFDTAHNFTLRRHIRKAAASASASASASSAAAAEGEGKGDEEEEAFAVVKVAFGTETEDEAWMLTSCGMDGV
ncbi:MAG: hypothetical protein Q9179_001627, partial [Wetmoreana sp. 5 TL-2023]